MLQCAVGVQGSSGVIDDSVLAVFRIMLAVFRIMHIICLIGCYVLLASTISSTNRFMKFAATLYLAIWGD